MKKPERTTKGPVVRDQPSSLEALGASTVGFAICDKQLRFRAVNGALANMNGIPAKSHLGKTIRNILGDAAASVEPAIERVLATGQTVSNFEISAKLPSRTDVGHWIQNYFPIRDSEGRVKQVGILVLEVNERNGHEETLRNAINKSLQRLVLATHELEVLMRQVLQGDAWTGALNCNADGNPQTSVARIHRLNSLSSKNFSGSDPGNSPHNSRRVLTNLPKTRIISPREREVIQLLAIGKTNKAISSILGIRVKTVEAHRSKIMLKLNLDSLAGLVRYAIIHKIVDL